jgi:hypothetical protein
MVFSTDKQASKKAQSLTDSEPLAIDVPTISIDATDPMRLVKPSIKTVEPKQAAPWTLRLSLTQAEPPIDRLDPTYRVSSKFTLPRADKLDAILTTELIERGPRIVASEPVITAPETVSLDLKVVSPATQRPSHVLPHEETMRSPDIDKRDDAQHRSPIDTRDETTEDPFTDNPDPATAVFVTDNCTRDPKLADPIALSWEPIHPSPPIESVPENTARLADEIDPPVHSDPAVDIHEPKNT